MCAKKKAKFPNDFLFVTCQVGAEPTLKAEIEKYWPMFTFAFSRPGFITYKLPANHAFPPDFELLSVFARSYGYTMGQVKGESIEELANLTLEAIPRGSFDRLHVFPRDLRSIGEWDFEPQITDESYQAEAAIRELWSKYEDKLGAVPDEDPFAEDGDFVLDVILVDQDHWFLGYHRVGPGHLPWPGGISDEEMPDYAVSRAFMKIHQAIEGYGLPLEEATVVAELGSSPGGACQALLDRGCQVIGIDPAEMDPVLLGDPNFQHIKKRSNQVPKKFFKDVQWLVSDMNVAPNYVFDSVEEIVKSQHTSIQGLILTIKMSDWKLAEQIPEYFALLKKWKFNFVRARQMQYHGQEFCLIGYKIKYK